MRWVPPAVAGIAFLSGGQSDEDATAHLNEINVLARERRAPWNLTFSYGRALQQPALHVWLGDDANNAKAQAAMMRRAALVSLASLGKYAPSMEAEGELASESLDPAETPLGCRLKSRTGLAQRNRTW